MSETNDENKSGLHPSRFLLGYLFTGALTGERRLAIETHLPTCARCAALGVEARRQGLDFLAAYPEHEHLARAVERRVKAVPAPSPLRRLGFFRNFLRPWPQIALTVLLLAAAGAYRYKAAPKPSEWTAKGQSRFYLFLNGAQIHEDTLPCKPMDTLQLGLTGPGPVHYAVLYKDDGEAIGVYMGGKSLPPLGRPKGENLPHSLILTAGWRRETLFCVWSPRAFSESEAKGCAVQPLACKGGLRLQVFNLLNARI